MIALFGILVFRYLLSVWFTPGINKHLITSLQWAPLIGFHFWTRCKSIQSSPVDAAVHSHTELVNTKSCCTCSIMILVQLFACFFNKQYTFEPFTESYDPREHFVAEKTFSKQLRNDGQNWYESFSPTTSTHRCWLNACSQTAFHQDLHSWHSAEKFWKWFLQSGSKTMIEYYLHKKNVSSANPVITPMWTSPHCRGWGIKLPTYWLMGKHSVFLATVAPFYYLRVKPHICFCSSCISLTTLRRSLRCKAVVLSRVLCSRKHTVYFATIYIHIISYNI